MNRYRKSFPRKHSFFVAIHVSSYEQTRRNADVAFTNGADGIFLVNHEIHHSLLLQIYEEMRRHLPHAWWIGLNLLGLPPRRAMNVASGAAAAGLWVDDSGILPGKNTADIGELQELWQQRKEKKFWEGIFFGGVAHKATAHQHLEGAVLKEVAAYASGYMDALVTTGQRTGAPPPTAKIRTLRDAIGDLPLIIASGVSKANVASFGDADGFIVNTSISKSFTELDPGETKRLGKIIHAL